MFAFRWVRYPNTSRMVITGTALVVSRGIRYTKPRPEKTNPYLSFFLLHGKGPYFNYFELLLLKNGRTRVRVDHGKQHIEKHFITKWLKLLRKLGKPSSKSSLIHGSIHIGQTLRVTQWSNIPDFTELAFTFFQEVSSGGKVGVDSYLISMGMYST